MVEVRNRLHEGLNVAAKDRAGSEIRRGHLRVVMALHPAEKVIGLIGQSADLARGHIEKVLVARRRISQSQPELCARIDKHDPGRRVIAYQMIRSQRSADSTTDDCDCFLGSHASKLARLRHEENFQIVIGHKHP